MSSDFPPVLILAGGLGTRLGDIAGDVPKAMVEVAGAPFIAHQLRLLARESVERVILCVSHMQEKIVEYVGDGRKFGLSVAYSYDGSLRLGTGGAVRKAMPLVDEQLAVLYGDTYLDIRFPPVHKTFAASGLPGLMTVLLNQNRWDTSNTLFRNGIVEAYDKHNPSPDMQHIDYGLIILSKRAIESSPEDQPFDLTVLFQQLIAARQMAGYEVTQRFYEIGTPQGLAEADAYLRQRARQESKAPSSS